MTDYAHVRIVLVEPRESGNVGAAARAMRNFGFEDLVLVGEPRPLDEASVWWASGAEDLVDAARRVGTLEEALEGVHLAVATSSGRGREEQPNRSPVEVGEIRRRMPGSEVIAVVFGRERGGLTRSELDLCAERSMIPTDERFPVMNLAQAVSLFCYELSARRLGPLSLRSGVASGSLALPEDTLRGDDSEAGHATHDEVERVHREAMEILLEAGFLNPDNPEAVYRELRDLLARARPSSRDATILLGVARQLRWALDQPSAARRRSETPEGS